MMAPIDKELEDHISKAGNKLIEPPSLDKLLLLLELSLFFGYVIYFCIFSCKLIYIFLCLSGVF